MHSLFPFLRASWFRYARRSSLILTPAWTVVGPMWSTQRVRQQLPLREWFTSMAGTDNFVAMLYWLPILLLRCVIFFNHDFCVFITSFHLYTCMVCNIIGLLRLVKDDSQMRVLQFMQVDNCFS